MTAATKPVRRKVRSAHVPHGVNPDIVVTIYPGAIIGLREARRRREYKVEVGALYARLVRGAIGGRRSVGVKEGEA